MTSELISIKGGTVTETTLELPETLSPKRWAEIGQQLGGMERAVGWWIGDWWNAGEKYKGRVDIVNSPDWKGPAYKTCRAYGSVAAKFDVSRRRDNLAFSHYQAVSALPEDEAQAILTAPGAPPTVKALRQHVKATRRDAREIALADKIEHASATLNTGKLFGVIMADPPWRFEPYARDTGLDRAADNHYPTMTLDELCELQPPMADDCALFLWATVPMLLDALDLMAAWRFGYRSHWVWIKPHPGTGYWNRNCHEILLLGVRGNVPAPAPGHQYDSVFTGETAGHSVKPAAAAEMIEEMFPHAALLEMFARGPRLGWTAWGAEAGGESNREHRENDSADPLFADDVAEAFAEVDARADDHAA